MEFTVTVSEDRGHIILAGHGELRKADHDRVIQSLQDAYTLAGQLGINRCLVDRRNGRNLRSPSEDFDFVHRRLSQEPAIHRGMRFVLLVDPADHSHDFVETVSRNAGYSVRLFRDPQTALEVLQG